MAMSMDSKSMNEGSNPSSFAKGESDESSKNV